MVVMYLDKALKLQVEGLVANGPRLRTEPPDEFISAVTRHPYAWGFCWLNKLTDDIGDPPKNVMYMWAKDNAEVTPVHTFCHGAYALDVRNMLSPVSMVKSCSSKDDFST